MDTNDVRYLSIRQTADVVGCSCDTIRRMVSRGELKAVRFGHLIRIPVGAVLRAGRPVTQVRRSGSA